MGIRKPSLSVTEARRLAETRNPAGPPSTSRVVPQGLPDRPEPAAATSIAPPAIEEAAKPVTPPAAVEKPVTITKPAVAFAQPGRGSSDTHLKSLLPTRADKVQVFISALLPAPGASTIYDMLCRQYPPQKALQMVLRRALHDYESMLEDGSFEKAPNAYPVSETAGLDDFVQTSRMMPKALVGIARAHFDPLGLESTRNFGRKLANAALASFFAREAAGR